MKISTSIFDYREPLIRLARGMSINHLTLSGKKSGKPPGRFAARKSDLLILIQPRRSHSTLSTLS